MKQRDPENFRLQQPAVAVMNMSSTALAIQKLTVASLPDMLTSLQVPLRRTFPSGQVHLAPTGLSRHMKSQDILRHGFDAVKKKKRGKNEPRR